MHFNLPAPSQVEIQVCDMLGKRIRSMQLELNAGSQQVAIPARSAGGEKMNSGFYLLKIEAGGIRATEKILLIK